MYLSRVRGKLSIAALLVSKWDNKGEFSELYVNIMAIYNATCKLGVLILDLGWGQKYGK